MKMFRRLIVSAALVAVMATPAYAQDSMPSAKQAAAMVNLVALGVKASSNPAPDTGWTDVLKTFIKTANQKDLAFIVALQCGLVTDTTVKSKGGQKDSSTAHGRISVRVKVRNLDTGEVAYAEPTADPWVDASGDDGPPGVTYCSRVQQLESSFSGLNCTADLETGAVTCTDPEELGLVLETLNANSFNFLLPDVLSGVQEITVQARGQADVSLGGTELGDGAAQAFIGLGSMHVDEIRLIRSDDGSSQM